MASIASLNPISKLILSKNVGLHKAALTCSLWWSLALKVN